MKKKKFIILIIVLAVIIAGLVVALLLKGSNEQKDEISEELRLAKESFRIELSYNKDEYYIYGLKKAKNLQGAKIVIPDSVDGIPVTKIIDKETSFSSFNNVSIIKLGKNVSYIGTSTYSNTDEKKYGESIFSGATSLTYIEVDSENKVYTSVDGVLYNKDKTVLIKYPAKKMNNVNQSHNKYEILDTVEVIYHKAFYCNKSLEIVVIPDSVLKIESESFSDCYNLYEVEFGKNVKEINSKAFMNCSSLDTVVLPDSLEIISNSAFKDCSKLVDITFGSKITNIGVNVFTGCLNLSSIYTEKDYVDDLVKLFKDAGLNSFIDKIKAK